MFVLDSHCDTPSQIHRLRNLGVDNPRAHVDFPKLRRGGVDGAFFALYTPASLHGEAATAHALTLLNELRDCVAANQGLAAFACDAGTALCNKAAARFSVFIGLENGSPLNGSLNLLRDFRREGVRYLTLVHSADNELGDSCSGTGIHGGLTSFGREILREMNRIGMLPDVSHASDCTFWDIVKYSDSPVVATHSSCRTLANHRRNLTDDMIRAIADTGGCVQVSIYPCFIDSDFDRRFSASGLGNHADLVEEKFIANPSDAAARLAWERELADLERIQRPSYKRVVDHIDHVVSLVGTKHVGIGTDYDGIPVTPEGLEDVSHFSLLLNELSARGYSDSEISDIAGGNFLRLLD